jgi:hypothetical protein
MKDATRSWSGTRRDTSVDGLLMAEQDEEYGLLDRAAKLLIKCKKPGLFKDRSGLAAEASACVALAAEMRGRRLVILEVEREAGLAMVEANKVKEGIRLAEWEKH